MTSTKWITAFAGDVALAVMRPGTLLPVAVTLAAAAYVTERTASLPEPDCDEIAQP